MQSQQHQFYPNQSFQSSNNPVTSQQPSSVVNSNVPIQKQSNSSNPNNFYPVNNNNNSNNTNDSPTMRSSNSLNENLNQSNPPNQPPRVRLTQDWQGSYPAQQPNYPSTHCLFNQPFQIDPWLQDEFPEIDLNTPMSEYWCTINYFEGDHQIGDIFKVRSAYNSVIIDGFFDASREDRFCLGALTNVQRTNASEKARLHIGKGVQLENMSDGSVYVRCLSEYSVFFESYYLDRESGREAFDAVHKIYPGSHVKVFSLRECLRCLKAASTTHQQQSQSQNGNTSSAIQNGAGVSDNSENGGVNVDELRKLCRLRFSFVKGWGPDYPRKIILETPSWCEIQLNRPLQYLDQLINSLSLNTNLCKL
jgi:MAD (mothers against decapentaplegic) family protein 4